MRSVLKSSTLVTIDRGFAHSQDRGKGLLTEAILLADFSNPLGGQETVLLAIAGVRRFDRISSVGLVNLRSSALIADLNRDREGNLPAANVVPDAPTRDLMDRFYENHWEKKMTVLEAFREAQLWMLREGRSRGYQGPGASDGKAEKLPPYYWAGFVLSGDWR